MGAAKAGGGDVDDGRGGGQVRFAAQIAQHPGEILRLFFDPPSGKRAGEFGDRLEFQPRGKNLGILTWRTGSRGVLKASVRKGPARAASATKARRPSTELTQQVPVVYWCVRKIEQPMDPARMPSTQDLLDLAALGVRRTIAAIAQQTAPLLS